jgi:predicted dehydrogenase
MIGIVGSGFGLYGYLPAVIEATGEGILLPERYRASFLERAELIPFAGAVRWTENETDVLSCARGLVVAVTPSMQRELIAHCLARSNIELLLLEKPLAPSPSAAMELLQDLLHSRINFRIGYTFRYTDWGQQLLSSLGARMRDGTVVIKWNFMAHHFRHNLDTWKRWESTGGGVVRFYGIHIIALLAEIGYRKVSRSCTFGVSPDELEKWTATFEGANLPICDVMVDTKARSEEFNIEYFPKSNSLMPPSTLTNLSDPFNQQSVTPNFRRTDRRFPALLELCRSLSSPTTSEYEWYAASLKLWHKVENRTQFKVLAKER